MQTGNRPIVNFIQIFLLLVTLPVFVFAGGDTTNTNTNGNSGGSSDSVRTSVMHFDFLSRKINQANYVEYGQYNILQIDNINRFLFDVKIESKQTEIETELNNQFISRITPSVSNSEEGETNETVENLKEKVSAKNAKIKEDNTNLKAGKLNDQQLINTGLVTSLTESVTSLSGVFRNLENIKVIKNELLNLSKTEHLRYEDSKNEVKEIEKTHADIENLSSRIDRFELFLEQYEEKKAAAIVDTVLMNDKEISKALKNMFKKVEEIKKLVRNTDYNAIIDEVTRLRRALKSENNFMAISAPVFAEKDYIVYDIKITPKKELVSEVGGVATTFKLKTPVTGGSRFDFTTGLVVLFGLNDYSYHLQQSEEDSTKSMIVENERTGKARISLGAMIHLSERTSSEFKLGVCAGIGLNADDISETNAYAGASFILGKENSVVLSGGVALSKINYLNSKYATNTAYTTSEISSDLVESVYRVGFFASITYNFAGGSED